MHYSNLSGLAMEDAIAAKLVYDRYMADQRRTAVNEDN